MKILAVRGENLASLEGFEIDFRDEWLGNAGLFAITGPTGAGKSTILDAISVALFDQTPRLQGRSGVKITPYGDEITSNDPRLLLRKGTGKGFAEVEFLGLDAVAYRARWTAWRAGERVTGKLQPQSVELWELASGDDKTESTKTLTLEAIQKKVGLTFEQFCRSVMLAQGDFAAFLKASEANRAELLEKMTDTDIYSRISIAAHERERHERTEVELLTRQLDGYALMTDVQLSAAQAWHDAAQNRLKELKRNLTLTEVKLRWHERHHDLKEQVARSKERVGDKEEAWNALETPRKRFEAVREVNPLRVNFLALRDLEKRREATRETLEKAQKKSEEFAQKARELDTKIEKSRAAEKAAEVARKEASSTLKAARELDTMIAQKSKDVESLKREFKEAKEELEKLSKSLEDKVKQLESNAQARGTLSTWLDSNRATKLVASEWGLYERLLKDFATVQQKSQKLVTDKAGLTRDLSELTKACAESRQKLQAATSELESIQEVVDRLGEASPTEALRGEGEREECYREYLEAVTEARQTAGAVIDERERLANLKKSIEDLKSRAAELEETRTAAKSTLVGRESALEEARKNEQRWTMTLDLESQRATLEDDEPCPLCGSPDHPWANNVPESVVAELEAQRKRISDLESQVSSIKDELARADERHKELSLKRQNRVEEQKNARARLEKLMQNWGDNCDKLRQAKVAAPVEPEPHWNEGSLDPETLEALDAHRALLNEELESIKSSLKKFSETMQHLEIKRQEREKKRKEVEEAKETLDALESKQRKLEHERRAIEDSLETMHADQRDRVQQLDPAFGGLVMWPTALRNDPAAFLERWRKDVEIWREKSKSLDRLQAEQQTLEKDHETLKVKHDQQQTSQQARSEKLERQDAEIEALRDERNTYFDGASADDIERKLDEDLAAARQKAEELKDSLNKLESDRAANAQSLKDSRKQLEELEAEIAPRNQAIEEGLEKHGIDREELGRRLEHDESWLEAQRKNIDAARDELSSAREVLKDREGELKDHEDGDSPEESREEITNNIRQINHNQEAARQLSNSMKQTLEIDRKARREVAEVQEQLEAQRGRHEVWKRLKALIGSSTGDVFRKYAQSLTLEVLLGYANDHLRSLKPRYILQRIPDARLSLQVVDREMGDDIRSIESLSGGETFLVSLALALGLSSLTSNRTRIESLFIDEGFGSLDSESLNDAISTLETLRAQGRTIGLISHVPGLAELIGNRVEVVPRGDGRSTLEFHGGTF